MGPNHHVWHRCSSVRNLYSLPQSDQRSLPKREAFRSGPAQYPIALDDLHVHFILKCHHYAVRAIWIQNYRFLLMHTDTHIHSLVERR